MQQSSETPGYLKVQYNEQPNQININVNQNQRQTNQQNVVSQIMEEQDKNSWKGWVEAILSGAISGAIGGAIARGINKSRTKEKMNVKKPDFKLDSTLDQSLLKFNQYNLDMQGVKQELKEEVQKMGGYDKLTQEGRQFYDETVKDIQQEQYNTNKDLINKWSYNDEELNKLKTKKQNLEDELKYMIPSNEEVKFQFQPSNEELEQIDSIFTQNQEDFMKNGIQTKEELIEEIKQSPTIIPNKLKVNDNADSSLFKLYKSTSSRYNDEMRKIQSFRDLNLQQQQNKINQQKQMIQKIDEQIVSGVKDELRPFLERLPDKYTKNKNGLIDYIYDTFNETGEGPYDKDVYRYNRYDGNDSLLYHLQGTAAPEKLNEYTNEINLISQDQNLTQEQKQSSILDKLKQNLPESILKDEETQKMINDIKAGNINKETILKGFKGILTNIRKELEGLKQNILDPLMNKTQGIENMTRQQKDLQGAGKVGMYIIDKLDKGTKEGLVELNDQIGNLDSLIQEIEQQINNSGNSSLSQVFGFLDKAKQKGFSILGKVSKATNKIDNGINKIVGGAVEGLEASHLDAIPMVNNLKQGMQGIQKISNATNGTLNKIYQLKDLNGRQLVNQGLDLIKGKTNNKDVSQLIDITKNVLDNGGKLNLSQIGQNNFYPQRRLKGAEYYERQLMEDQKNNQLMDVVDIENLLDRNIEQQHDLINQAKQRGSIYFRDYIQTPQGEKIELDRMKAPTQKEKEQINKLLDQQKQLLNEDYINNSYILRHGKPLLDEQQEILNAKRQYQRQKEGNPYLKQTQNELNQLQQQGNEIIESITNKSHRLQQLVQSQNEIKPQIKQLEKNIQLLEEQKEKEGNYYNITQNEKEKKSTYNKIQQLQNELSKNYQDLKHYKDKLQQIVNEAKIIQDDNDKLNKDLIQNSKMIQLKQNQLNDLNNVYDKQIDLLNQRNQRITEQENIQNKIITPDGEIYDRDQITQQIEETENQLNDIEDELNKFQPQLEYMNNMKDKNKLSPLIRRQIEETFYNHNKEQERIHITRDGKFDPYVPIPTTIQTFYKPKGYKPDTINQTKLKLQQKGYNPNKSYSYVEKELRQREDQQWLNYNKEIQNKLESLYDEYNLKLRNAKTYNYPRLIQEYKTKYNNIINNKQQVEMKPQNIKQGSDQMNINDLLPQNQRQIYENISEYSQKQFDQLNRKGVKSKQNKFIQEYNQAKANFKDKNKQRTAFYDSLKQQFDQLKRKPFNQENLKEYNQWWDNLSKENKNKLPLFQEKQTTKEYLEQFDQEVQNKYKPTQEELEYQNKKQQKPENFYPYMVKTFELQEQNEVPIRKYLQDKGVDLDRDLDLTKRKGLQFQSPVEQREVIHDLIKDDILFSYNGDDEQVKQFRDLIQKDINYPFTQNKTRDERNVAKRNKQIYQSEYYNTNDFKQRLNNLRQLTKNLTP